MVFHAGTERAGDQVHTAGGRVLAVSGLGTGVPGAREQAYAVADRISFDELHRREDIAARVT
jgi:phosphoribosylamine--glycine ligase